ncbi:hypothetical protein HTZ84_22100 [Haloterrigena sp. SYSU A558-1]|uniref:DUF7718 domain-containing protein n=1 Tax=Haloterrigena gelatinilytica TaxID=2741724 RepID=A0ABX2LHM7_9EURY|nr:hypothetical protein [Haloterrigena gelatinilytica]NUC74960.1 hypothetical protein [Haloterrigena gelatinilytica]
MSDELWTVWEDWEAGYPEPPSRIQMRIKTSDGLLTEFCVQLEYNMTSTVPERSPFWMQVARFDHNVALYRGHDVRHEGLHMDIYGNGEKVDVLHDFPEVPLEEAPKWCRGFLEAKREQLLQNFEQRIGAPRRVYDS